MRHFCEPVIEGKPYRVLFGYGYRCFIHGKWYDCDKYGNIKKGYSNDRND